MKGKFEMNIGVIGLGYVGSAMVGGMENHFNVLSYDKFKGSFLSLFPTVYFEPIAC